MLKQPIENKESCVVKVFSLTFYLIENYPLFSIRMRDKYLFVVSSLPVPVAVAGLKP